VAKEQQSSLTLRDELRLKEYDGLLEKMAHTRNDVTRAEYTYPIAIGAIYAWIFSNPPPLAFLWQATLFIPIGIAILAIVRLYSRRKGMDLLETYIREAESEIYGSHSELGWERRYGRERPLKFLIWFRAGLVTVLLVVTIGMACASEALYHQVQQSASTQHR
jgi:hypothetical protein